MPQMAPLSWLLLFMFFTTMMILFNVMNYYLFVPNIKNDKSNTNRQIKTSHWKW
uniref:ATP synthase complex subunit 8 n=1 Tax=Davidius lunatus TaxID=318828 RepID=C3RUL7_DAVLU|nr:ATP synthase F0 subunit 8 [Davidius lunatus]ACB48043.1 ATP synthase F0 subunit 8 [Davidius lunatus]